MIRSVIILLICICMAISGCFMPPATSVPMDAISLRNDPSRQSDTVFVFLPGRRDEPRDFISNGFVDALRKKGIDADVVIADAHLGYYYERILDERLWEDVVGPLKGKGYRQIWAAGVSLGGFGAIMFERDHPGTWDGVIMIAPFIGDQDAVLESIIQEQDLASVRFPDNLSEDDYSARFWQWMQAYQQKKEFPIYLGLGTGDRMYEEQSALKQAVDPDKVIEIEGGHVWTVWQILWDQLLDRWIKAGYKTD